ncbi:MAG: hypothetical protein ACU4F9_02085 [Arcticibacter sp.]
MQGKTAKTLGLVITDGVGVRNYVHGRFLSISCNSFEKVVLFTGVPSDSLGSFFHENLEVVNMIVFSESRWSSFWRKTAEMAHLFRFQTPAMREIIKMNSPKGRNAFAIRNRISWVLARLLSFFKLQALAGNIYESSLNEHPLTVKYKQLLVDYNVDLLFFTHQRPPQIAPMAIAGKQLGIPTVAYIFSWDNLSSKGRMPVLFDRFMVWSNLMKSELLQFYPTLDPNDVSVSGTPQFETYVYDEFGWSRLQLNRYLSLTDTDFRRIICFSCGDVSTSPNDAIYIDVIASAIKSGELGNNLMLLVRTSPAEDGSRFKELVTKYPSIVWNIPNWPQSNPAHPEPWSQRVPSMDDIHCLKSILQHASVSVNMCSTMSLDFALWDKPVINPVFGSLGNDLGLFPDRKYLKYDHYAKVIQTGAVTICANPDELVSAIRAALAQPEHYQYERKQVLELEIGQPLKGTSERFVKQLIDWVS